MRQTIVHIGSDFVVTRQRPIVGTGQRLVEAVQMNAQGRHGAGRRFGASG